MSASGASKSTSGVSAGLSFMRASSTSSSWKCRLNAQGVATCIDGQGLAARVDAIELKRTAGICRGICAVDALGGKCAAGGKVLESHIAAGKIEDTDGMLDRGDVELPERDIHGAHQPGHGAGAYRRKEAECSR